MSYFLIFRCLVYSSKNKNKNNLGSIFVNAEAIKNVSITWFDKKKKKSILKKKVQRCFLKPCPSLGWGSLGLEIASVYFFLPYIYTLVSFPPALVDVILSGKWQARIIHSLGPGESRG